MCNCYPTISLDTAARVLSHNPSGLNVRIGSPPWNIRLAMNYERPTFGTVRIRSNAQRACARRYAKRDPENIIEKRRNSAGLKKRHDISGVPSNGIHEIIRRNLADYENVHGSN